MTGAAALRGQFPLFGKVPRPFHYLDSGATAQIHASALEAMQAFDTTARANVQRGTYPLAEAATGAFEAARGRVRRFLGAGPAEEVVFTAGATAALNLVARAFGETLAAGDEVVISVAEHHSNFLPWLQLRDRAGIVLRVLPVGADGRLDLAALERVVTARCRLLAVTHCSNVTGAVTDVEAIVAAARAVGARVLLDGAQAVQHGPVDVAALGVDFYAFSGHKAFGPTGVGVLWGRGELLAGLPPFMTGGGMVGEASLEGAEWLAPPARFEAGTPPVAAAVGLGAVLEWMGGLPWGGIRAREAALARRLLDGLAGFPGLRLLGPMDLECRAPLVSFELAGLHPHDIAQVLGDRGVAVRGGHHCARPLLAALGCDGATRASLALYNDEADVDALLEGLAAAVRILS
ncbi:MAG: aminotransferase class V-fold PLP-dependent enzyme [Rhodocyclaceae bacterium]|nr:aminotransferase class V-fold PLP-dependent enzyme [Rhodocyclaceae bacterium]